MTVPVLNFQDFIAADGEQLTTDSRKVAVAFRKQHRDVLRLIRIRVEEAGEWGLRNFTQTSYVDPQNGQTYPMFSMTKDGFTFIAQKFNGAKAVQFQIAYIEAFNAMASYIKNQREGLQFDYLRKELEHKTKKEKVSVCAREMRNWQDEKPALEGELKLMLEQMQPSLLPN